MLSPNEPELTFCLISSGELTSQDCYDQIEPYLKKKNFKFQEVTNVAPQYTAFNQMIKQCNTEFLIPLDADMLLKRNAINQVTHTIKNWKDLENWHTILFPVYDTQFEITGRSLKVFRTEILSEVPFKDVRFMDNQHWIDLQSKGYTAIDLTEGIPIADHVVKGEYFSYMRAKNHVIGAKTHLNKTKAATGELPKGMFKLLIEGFQILLSKNDLDSKYAIMGAYDGFHSDTPPPHKNSDDWAKRTYVKPSIVAPPTNEKKSKSYEEVIRYSLDDYGDIITDIKNKMMKYKVI